MSAAENSDTLDARYPLLEKALKDFFEGLSISGPKELEGAYVYAFTSLADLMMVAKNPSEEALGRLAKRTWIGRDRVGEAFSHVHEEYEKLVDSYDPQCQTAALVVCRIRRDRSIAWGQIVRSAGATSPPSEFCAANSLTANESLRLQGNLLKRHDPSFFPPHRCGHCQQPRAGGSVLNLRCGCKIARYCNEKCQKAHWGTHRQMCRDLYTLEEEGEDFLRDNGVPDKEIRGDRYVKYVLKQPLTLMEQDSSGFLQMEYESGFPCGLQNVNHCGGSDAGSCSCSAPLGAVPYVRCVACTHACHPGCVSPVKGEPDLALCEYCLRFYGFPSGTNGTVDVRLHRQFNDGFLYARRIEFERHAFYLLSSEFFGEVSQQVLSTGKWNKVHGS